MRHTQRTPPFCTCNTWALVLAEPFWTAKALMSRNKQYKVSLSKQWLVLTLQPTGRSWPKCCQAVWTLYLKSAVSVVDAQQHFEGSGTDELGRGWMASPRYAYYLKKMETFLKCIMGFTYTLQIHDDRCKQALIRAF